MSRQHLAPVEVLLKHSTSSLEITWSDGEISDLSGASLRRYCACSGCRSRKVIGTELLTDSGKIRKIQLMGSTGLQIVFADGHDRGVFPWSYIQAIANGEALQFLDQ
ncbi:MAG: DUF971 family protein [Parvicella sp.]|jgi:DUF971 family protein